MNKNKISFPVSDALLEQSLTHRSYAMLHNVKSNERLEYLGDAVLELIVSEELMNRFASANEGELSRMRANIVSEKCLAKVALHWGLEDKIKISGIKNNKLPSILSDTVEAIIGAVYLENGFENAKMFVGEHFDTMLSNAVEITESYDYKTKLQEFLQKGGKTTPVYKLIGEGGQAHNKEFTVGVFFDGKELASGTGRNKKQAGQNAAKTALEKLKEQN